MPGRFWGNTIWDSARGFQPYKGLPSVGPLAWVPVWEWLNANARVAHLEGSRQLLPGKKHPTQLLKEKKIKLKKYHFSP